MKTKTTYEALPPFINTAQAWLNAVEVEKKDAANHLCAKCGVAAEPEKRDKGNRNTKLGHALQRVLPRAEKLWNKYLYLYKDIEIDNCSVDEKGIIEKDVRDKFLYTKEGLRKCNRQIQVLFESEIEIDPYFATFVPKDLTIAEKIAFSGFVITVEQADAEEDMVEQKLSAEVAA